MNVRKQVFFNMLTHPSSAKVSKALDLSISNRQCVVCHNICKKVNKYCRRNHHLDPSWGHVIKNKTKIPRPPVVFQSVI